MCIRCVSGIYQLAHSKSNAMFILGITPSFIIRKDHYLNNFLSLFTDDNSHVVHSSPYEEQTDALS